MYSSCKKKFGIKRVNSNAVKNILSQIWKFWTHWAEKQLFSISFCFD